MTQEQAPAQEQEPRRLLVTEKPIFAPVFAYFARTGRRVTSVHPRRQIVVLSDNTVAALHHKNQTSPYGKDDFDSNGRPGLYWQTSLPVAVVELHRRLSVNLYPGLRYFIYIWVQPEDERYKQQSAISPKGLFWESLRFFVEENDHIKPYQGEETLFVDLEKMQRVLLVPGQDYGTPLYDPHGKVNRKGKEW